MNNFEKIKEYEAHKTPVPSYEEWQAKLEENAQLKELLKECEEKILLMDFDSIKIEILQKIDEVLQ